MWFRWTGSETAFYQAMYRGTKNGDTRESLEATSFRAAWSEGRAMSMQQVVEYALAETCHDHVPDAGMKRGAAE